MELIKFEEYIKKYNHKIVATIGSFDGIHLGHQELIKMTVDKAKELKVYSAVITFDPHPLNVIANKNHSTITSLSEKVQLIKTYGVDYLILINFDEAFSKISKIDFINNYLIKMNVSNLIVGNNMPFNKVKCPHCQSEKHTMEKNAIQKEYEYVCVDCGTKFNVSLEEIIKKM